MNRGIEIYSAAGKTGRNDLAVILILLATAMLIRGIIGGVQVIASDGVLYIKIAKDMAAGDFAAIGEYGFLNLYSILIALFHALFGDWEVSGKAVSVLFGSLSVVPLFLLVRNLFDSRIAAVTALFYVIHPNFVEFAADVLREPTLWFFALSALWLASEGMSRKRPLLLALSALCSGLAMFTRLEGAVVFAVVILWLLFTGFVWDRENRTKSVVYLSVFVFVSALMMLPVIMTRGNGVEVGHPIEKLGQLVTAKDEIRTTPDVSGTTISPNLAGLLDIARRHQYALFGIEVGSKFLKVFNVLFLVFFLFGIVKRRVTRYSSKDAMLLIWFAVAFLSLYVYVAKVHYVSSRHALFLLLPALAWSAVGLFEFREKLRGRFGQRGWFDRYARHETAIILMLVLAIVLPQTATGFRHDKTELRDAGIILRANGYSANVFVVQPTLARVAFYAHADVVQLPIRSDDKTLAALFKKYRNGILVIDERTIDDYVPGLRRTITESRFEKLALPLLSQYKDYSFAIYRIP